MVMPAQHESNSTMFIVSNDGKVSEVQNIQDQKHSNLFQEIVLDDLTQSRDDDSFENQTHGSIEKSLSSAHVEESEFLENP